MSLNPLTFERIEMGELVGVTLEFRDGSRVSNDVEQIYMAAPEMYKVLKDMEFLAEEGDLELPAGVLRKIKQALPSKKPVILQGAFE
jgi:hypothetical protein